MTVHHAWWIVVAFLSCFLHLASLPKCSLQPRHCWISLKYSAQGEHQRWRKRSSYTVLAGNTQLVAACWDNFQLVAKIASRLCCDPHLWLGPGTESGCCEVCLWCPLSTVPTAMQAQLKVGSGSFCTSRQIPDQLSGLYLSGLSLMELCLPDTCLSLYTAAFKETFSSVIFQNKAAMGLGRNDVFSWCISPPPGVASAVTWCSELMIDKVTALTKVTFEKASVSLLSNSKLLSCLH